MSRPYLPSNFVMQSSSVARFRVTVDGATMTGLVAIEAGRGLAISLNAHSRSHDATVRVAGLLPNRFYRIEGDEQRFSRADERGVATIRLSARPPGTLALWPVV